MCSSSNVNSYVSRLFKGTSTLSISQMHRTGFCSTFTYIRYILTLYTFSSVGFWIIYNIFTLVLTKRYYTSSKTEVLLSEMCGCRFFLEGQTEKLPAQLIVLRSKSWMLSVCVRVCVWEREDVELTSLWRFTDQLASLSVCIRKWRGLVCVWGGYSSLKQQVQKWKTTKTLMTFMDFSFFFR